MARNLENQSNITPPSADYPSGRIKDDTGAGDGTPVDEAVYGDINQLFAKLMREAPFVTPNDLPDNTTNGFQLYEALANLAIRPALANVGFFDYSNPTTFTFGATEQINDIWTDEKYVFVSVTDGASFYILRSAIETFGFGSLIVLAAEASKLITDETYLYIATDGVGIKAYLKEDATPVPARDIATAVNINGLSIYNGTLYIGNTTNSRVDTYVAATGAFIGSIATGVADINDISVEGNKLYITADLSTDILVYDVDNNTLQDTVSIGGISAKSMTVYGGNMYVFAGAQMLPWDQKTHAKNWRGIETFYLSSAFSIFRTSMNYMFALNNGADDEIRRYPQILGRL